jgi:hypothetical protein
LDSKVVNLPSKLYEGVQWSVVAFTACNSDEQPKLRVELTLKFLLAASKIGKLRVSRY